MSQNLILSAERAVTVNKTGAQSVQATGFELFQTPTHVAKLILASDDRKAAYIAWATERGRGVTEELYAPDDFWEETPIGTRTYNSGTEHIAKLEEFLVLMEKEGYDVTWGEV